VARREYLINRVVHSYPRGVYAIHGSSGTQFYCPQERLFCVPTRAGCARVLQIWGLLLHCQFIISNALAQLLSRHFRLLWPFLQGVHPLDLFLALIHCLPHRLIFSGVHCYLLEPSTLFSFSGCITRLVSHLPFGRLGVYCIFDTPAISWAGLGCPFWALLYLSKFNPCGEVYCSSWGNCGSFTVTSVTLNTLNSIFEHHGSVTRISV
jgi:hypothetical protein